MPKNKAAKSSGSYGIAEWYGDLYRGLPQSERVAYTQKKRTEVQCRFLAGTPALIPKSGPHCKKDNGVCSMCSFTPKDGDAHFGPVTAMCPNRFLEDGLLVRTIGKLLLGTETPLIVKEIPFLKRTPTSEIVDDAAKELPDIEDASDKARMSVGKENVGRIDMVCVNPDLERFNWCAVEIQAVYFSGAKLSKDFQNIKDYTGNGIPFPAGNRRPDFRSSGPKRLMPQLQVKVPTLRRWGKKMAVVVDEPFFNALGKMAEVDDVSNSDIIWVVVGFVPNTGGTQANMTIRRTVMTTLERAVEGLTAGEPTTLSDFEDKIRDKLPKPPKIGKAPKLL